MRSSDSRVDAPRQKWGRCRRNSTSISATFSPAPAICCSHQRRPDLAKVESGKMEFRPEPVDLVKLTARCATSCGASRRASGCVFDIEVDPEWWRSCRPGPCETDPLQLPVERHQVHARRADGSNVRILPEGPTLFRIDVRDTASACASEHLSRPLLVEFPANWTPARRRSTRGPVLGLALTKRLVEAHGGRVSVHSVPGRAGTFSAILPRNGAAVRADDLHSSLRPAPARG